MLACCPLSVRLLLLLLLSCICCMQKVSDTVPSLLLVLLLLLLSPSVSPSPSPPPPPPPPSPLSPIHADALALAVALASALIFAFVPILFQVLHLNPFAVSAILNWSTQQRCLNKHPGGCLWLLTPGLKALCITSACLMSCNIACQVHSAYECL
ncbi:hypothetical protein ABBQ38_010891 [Trebouxia sp. C0009 RCD-2024]